VARDVAGYETFRKSKIQTREFVCAKFVGAAADTIRAPRRATP